MRKRRTPLRLACALLIFLFLLPGAEPAHAIIPVTDAVHIALNLLYHVIHYIQFAQQIVNQYEQIRNQVQQIKNEYQSLKKLDIRNWREVYDLISYMDYLMRQGKALAYSLDNVLETYNATFPGSLPWKVYPDESQLQVRSALDTFGNTLRTLHQDYQHDINDQLLLERIKGQVDAAQGPQEALEALNSLQTFNAQELSVTKRTLAATANLHAVFYAHQLNREAQSEATFRQVLTNSLAQPSPTSAGFSFQPSWSRYGG
jgi:P-type conjugative transfer protein TrbJ